jgi:hypothetical protein
VRQLHLLHGRRAGAPGGRQRRQRRG